MTRFAHIVSPPPKNIDKIVVISVDDESFKLLNKKWPWRRLMFAYLVDKLAADKPKVISLDFSFIGKSDIEDDDRIISEAFFDAGNVLSASYFAHDGQYMKPLEKIAASSLGYGFINKPRDADFYVRRARSVLFSKEDKAIDYSLVLKTFAVFKNIPLEDIKYDGKNIVIKDALIPVDKEGSYPVDFRLRFNEFKVIPFWQIIKVDFPPGTFKDKIVLVGPTNEILHDVHNTPLGLMPGAIINANELLMLVNNNFVKYLPKWLEFLLLCIFVVSIAILTYRAIKPRILFKVIGAVVVFWEFGLFLYSYNIRLDYFAPVALIVASYLGISIYKYFHLIVQNIALKTEAITDELTGLYAYRYFILRLHSELERSKRYNVSLSLVMMDIDHFKKINDTYGHETGNIILKQVSEILKENTRKADIVFRYGGEELCILLTHTPKEGAFSYSEKIRKFIEEYPFAGNKAIKVTLSFGIAAYPEDNVYSGKEIINAADIALYHAKETGRNRVVLYEPSLLAKAKTKTLE
jgi:diguanylate cyclase (GGDEF)-like protein